MELPEEQAPRRKPSQKKPPKKARHKHNYKPCIYHIVVKHGHLDLERGFVPEIRTVPGDYCITCGKVGDVHYFWGWSVRVSRPNCPQMCRNLIL